jgi:hypothetical protein
MGNISRVVLIGLVALLVGGLTQVAQAHRTTLSVQVISEQSTISPDGRSMSFLLETVCDRQWTIVEAQVSVTQANASGSGSFTPTCGRIPYNVGVTVPVTQGIFETGATQATAVLVVGQGPNKRDQDSGLLRARPSVSVILADQGRLRSDGSVLIDITVTCPMSAVGQGGQVVIYDGVIRGVGTFGPTPCDAVPLTVSVRVSSNQGSFRVGSAEAEGSASATEGGDVFPAYDLRTIQIVQA